MIALAALAAWGAPPAADLRPVATAAGVQERYTRWRELEGLPPERLVCQVAWAEVVDLCFRVWEQGKRRWVVVGDLAAWGADAAGLRATLAEPAAERVRAAELAPIEGMSTSYLRLVDGDGWAAAGLLRPELVAERLGGGPVRVALPAESVLVAWKVQGDEVDKVMAVGVRELYEGTPGAVSPKIVTWDAGKWIPFGEARPR